MLAIRTLTTSINRMALATVVVAGLIFAAGASKTAVSGELSAHKTLHKTMLSPRPLTTFEGIGSYICKPKWRGVEFHT